MAVTFEIAMHNNDNSGRYSISNGYPIKMQSKKVNTLVFNKMSLLRTLAAILALTVAVAYAKTQTWGVITPSDVLIHKTNIAAPMNKQGKNVIAYDDFPGRGKKNPYPLTAIKVIDNLTGPRESEVTLRKGGLNHLNSTVEVKSKLYQPIDVTILYYAKRDPKVRNQYIQ
ncbi:uncharacterized protein LOC142241017 [Haematobia irritans]|uniref:uncharacterized protein LOC142241017 n=1 Tax=Haematobia irritans TaxID=7368 RepID=UPI003F4F828D